MDLSTVEKAIEWLRENPSAGVGTAKKAGMKSTTYYKARKALVDESTKKPESDRPPRMTKVGLAAEWIKANPGKDVHQALAAGHTNANFYAAKRIVAGNPYKRHQPKTQTKQTKGRRAAIVRHEPVHIRVTPTSRKVLNLVLQLGMDALVAELSQIQKSVEAS